MPRARVRERTPAWIASPVAVPPRGLSALIASAIAARSRVGDWRMLGRVLKAITPTLTCLGTRATKLRAARWAATRRLGATSLASIDPLTSVARRIEARSTGTATVVRGRAAATMRTPSAIAKISIGTCRRQPGRFGATEATRAGAANAAAARVRSRWCRR